MPAYGRWHWDHWKDSTLRKWLRTMARIGIYRELWDLLLSGERPGVAAGPDGRGWTIPEMAEEIGCRPAELREIVSECARRGQCEWRDGVLYLTRPVLSKSMPYNAKARPMTNNKHQKQKGTTKSETKDSVFEQFWAAWPQNTAAYKRKASKQKCLAKWRRDRLDNRAEHVLRVLEHMKRSKDWTKAGGAYIPAPLTWLNQQRWDMELPEEQPEGTGGIDLDALGGVA